MWTKVGVRSFAACTEQTKQRASHESDDSDQLVERLTGALRPLTARRRTAGKWRCNTLLLTQMSTEELKSLGNVTTNIITSAI